MGNRFLIVFAFAMLCAFLGILIYKLPRPDLISLVALSHLIPLFFALLGLTLAMLIGLWLLLQGANEHFLVPMLASWPWAATALV